MSPWSGTRGLILYYTYPWCSMLVVVWRCERDSSKPQKYRIHTNTHFMLSSGRPRPRSRSVSPFDTHLTQPTWKTEPWRHTKSLQPSQELHTYSILAINCPDMCQKYVFRDKYIIKATSMKTPSWLFLFNWLLIILFVLFLCVWGCFCKKF